MLMDWLAYWYIEITIVDMLQLVNIRFALGKLVILRLCYRQHRFTILLNSAKLIRFEIESIAWSFIAYFWFQLVFILLEWCLQELLDWLRNKKIPSSFCHEQLIVLNFSVSIIFDWTLQYKECCNKKFFFLKSQVDLY